MVPYVSNLLHTLGSDTAYTAYSKTLMFSVLNKRVHRMIRPQHSQLKDANVSRFSLVVPHVSNLLPTLRSDTGYTAYSKT